jgi:hypothetical protein
MHGPKANKELKLNMKPKGFSQFNKPDKKISNTN